jgi:hypothetical protein
VFGLDIYITAAEDMTEYPMRDLAFLGRWAISESSLSSGEMKEPRYLNCQLKWMFFPSGRFMLLGFFLFSFLTRFFEGGGSTLPQFWIAVSLSPMCSLGREADVDISTLVEVLLPPLRPFL